MAKEKRFVITYPDGLNGFALVIDAQTGVNYIMMRASPSPLFNADGTLIVTPVPEQES